MAYDEFLADRVRGTLKNLSVPAEEKKMFGGICFMVDEKMCIGVVKNELMARVDPEIHSWAVSQHGCREMDFTGQSMKGFVFIEPKGIDLDLDLEKWIKLCLDYNPKAKKSKKK